MEKVFNYLKIALVLCLCMAVQRQSGAQSFMASTASTSKIARVSLGEGIAEKNRLLLELVTKAGLMPVLSNDEEHTFFVPAEQVLAQHKDDSPEGLRVFLEQHIVKGNLTTADLRDGADLKTLNGDNLRICRKKGAVLVAGVRLKETDQLYANGVWHRLNGAFQLSKPSL